MSVPGGGKLCSNMGSPATAAARQAVGGGRPSSRRSRCAGYAEHVTLEAGDLISVLEKKINVSPFDLVGEEAEGGERKPNGLRQGGRRTSGLMEKRYASNTLCALLSRRRPFCTEFIRLPDGGSIVTHRP